MGEVLHLVFVTPPMRRDKHGQNVHLLVFFIGSLEQRKEMAKMSATKEENGMLGGQKRRGCTPETWSLSLPHSNPSFPSLLLERKWCCNGCNVSSYISLTYRISQTCVRPPWLNAIHIS